MPESGPAQTRAALPGKPGAPAGESWLLEDGGGQTALKKGNLGVAVRRHRHRVGLYGRMKATHGLRAFYRTSLYQRAIDP